MAIRDFNSTQLGPTTLRFLGNRKKAPVATVPSTASPDGGVSDLRAAKNATQAQVLSGNQRDVTTSAPARTSNFPSFDKAEAGATIGTGASAVTGVPGLGAAGAFVGASFDVEDAESTFGGLGPFSTTEAALAASSFGLLGRSVKTQAKEKVSALASATPVEQRTLTAYARSVSGAQRTPAGGGNQNSGDGGNKAGRDAKARDRAEAGNRARGTGSRAGLAGR